MTWSENLQHSQTLTCFTQAGGMIPRCHRHRAAAFKDRGRSWLGGAAVLRSAGLPEGDDRVRGIPPAATAARAGQKAALCAAYAGQVE